MKGWVILIGTLAVGFVLGVGAGTRGSTLVAPYLSRAVGGPSEHLEGQVVRKQRDGNRLLVKVATAQGPIGVVPGSVGSVPAPAPLNGSSRRSPWAPWRWPEAGGHAHTTELSPSAAPGGGRPREAAGGSEVVNHQPERSHQPQADQPQLASQERRRDKALCRRVTIQIA
jgi:hypothetical protein